MIKLSLLKEILEDGSFYPSAIEIETSSPKRDGLEWLNDIKAIVSRLESKENEIKLICMSLLAYWGGLNGVKVDTGTFWAKAADDFLPRWSGARECLEKELRDYFKEYILP